MKRAACLITFLVCVLLFVGCAKEEFAAAPVYGKIYCSSSHPVVGDTVLLSVEVFDAGNRLNRAEYNWKFKSPFGNSSQSTQKVLRKSGDKSIPQPPTMKYVFKESGTYTITLAANFSYSMGDVNSVMKGSSRASGQIKVNPKSSK